jgi:hypothetical protein
MDKPLRVGIIELGAERGWGYYQSARTRFGIE